MNTDTFKRKLFGYLFIGFLLGVLLGHFYVETIFFSYFLILMGIGSICLSLIFRKSEVAASLFLISSMILFGGLGAMKEKNTQPEAVSLFENSIGQEVRVYGKVISDPSLTPQSKRVVMEAGGAKILAYFSKETEIYYGDIILAEGKLSKPEIFLTDSGREFDYPSYLAKDGILYIQSFGEITQRLGNEGNKIKSALFKIKRSSISQVDELFLSPANDLLGGMLLGETGNKDLEESFRVTGLSHIVVLSGYNIAVISVLVGATLSFLPRKIRVPLILLTITGFTIMVASGASTIRAAAMAFAVILARASSRQTSAWRALFIAVFVMVFWNPAIIFYDPGFQLSFLATTGLLVFGNFFEKHLGFVSNRFKLREMVAASLSAQITVLPLIVYLSGYFSAVSLPANILVLPAVAPTMLLGSISILLASLGLGGMWAYPASFLLNYILNVSDFFAKMSFAQIPIPHLAFSCVLLLYLAGGGAYYYLYRKKTRQEVESFNLKVFGRAGLTPGEPGSQNPRLLSAS